MNLIFDIGCNQGKYLADAIRKWPSAKFVAVEPQLHHFSDLVSNFGSRVFLYNKAVSSSFGTATLLHCNEDSGVSSIDNDFLEKSCFRVSEKLMQDGKAFKDHYTFDRPTEVETITVDYLIEEHGLPDFIKIDVEGHEYEVLLGLSQKVPLITFEWHEPLRDKVVKSIRHLETIGFTLFSTEIWHTSHDYHDNEITNYKTADEFISGFDNFLDCPIPEDRVWVQRSGMVWAK